MKNRATIICGRGDAVLLVARRRSRWSLPGGTIRPSESMQDAALREFEEETGVRPKEVTYLFLFSGLAKAHHVFLVDIVPDAQPRPCNEIAKCRWFDQSEIALLPVSVPTRSILNLFFRHHGSADESGSVQHAEKLHVLGH